jgi:hypothetical protein
VLGHDREQFVLPMTVGTYGGQSNHDAHRTYVEAAKLPKPFRAAVAIVQPLRRDQMKLRLLG